MFQNQQQQTVWHGPLKITIPKSWVVVNKTFYNPLNGYNYLRKSPKKSQLFLSFLFFLNSHQM